MSDILDRVFGPEPSQDKFAPLNESKIIPYHDCEFVETRVWVPTGMIDATRCRVCRAPPPPIVEEI